jgi:hypothetical protein
MYVKEMHIEVNQSLQKISANTTRKMFPEEIDWLLNKHQDRFIKNKLKPRGNTGGFEIEQVDSDAIRTLIKTNVQVPAYKYGARYGSNLPGDYKYLIADSSAIKKLCNKTATAENVTENLLVIPIKKTVGTSPFYSTVTLTINGSVVFSIASLAQDNNSDYTGFNSSEQIYEISAALLHAL